ncbi:hypothetical protein BSL82_00635 [Tardibacter chloracetimidivorans]|uniref:Uncharacterized protein n=1 Tax=Tardibacter chloracetimidivorans TaxID=1921510 RepID=A0A1L3ZQU3_9SPHN|nr:hypothetical protein [Tardibacter chloracetimidivorans]API57991.1 hypothetical protein BSL82_00635 [Tardibacter chloracetimidivorans]
MTDRNVKLPTWVKREVERAEGDRVVIAAVLTITTQEVGRYSALGLRAADGRIITGDPAPPPPSGGRYARRNINGWEDKRTDRPKQKREISHWAPSWNSGSHHLVSREIHAYPVDHHPAKLLTISASVLEDLADGALVRFRADQPLEKKAESFASDLLFNLRLLREAVGDAHVFDADLSDEAFARIQHVDWELLPQGSADRVLARLAARKGADPERLKVADERLRELDRLGNNGFILGTGRFARYFGAKFGDRLIALENLEYGNALYAFEEDWEQLTQPSRTELIRRRDPSVHRIPHVPGWQSAIRKLVRAR